MSYPVKLFTRVNEDVAEMISRFAARNKVNTSEAMRMIFDEYFEINDKANFVPSEHRKVLLLEFMALNFERFLKDDEDNIGEILMDEAAHKVELHHG